MKNGKVDIAPNRKRVLLYTLAARVVKADLIPERGLMVKFLKSKNKPTDLKK